MSQSRNWVFTLNNYTEDEVNALRKYPCDYIIIGFEVGAEGTPHLQGYIEFPGVKRFETLKKFNPRIRWAKRAGSASQASEYCKKDNNFESHGNLSAQGERNDLTEIGDLIVKENASLASIAEDYPSQFVRYHKGFTALKNAVLKDRTEAPKVYWLWGPTGVGKTRHCVETHPSFYIKDSSMWWDGYEQQQAIVIDDYEWNYNRETFRNLLRLLDRYPYQGQVKGGFVKINSPFIYITCEYPPENYWKGADYDQMKRRITEIIHVS